MSRTNTQNLRNLGKEAPSPPFFVCRSKYYWIFYYSQSNATTRMCGHDTLKELSTFSIKALGLILSCYTTWIDSFQSSRLVSFEWYRVPP